MVLRSKCLLGLVVSMAVAGVPIHVLAAPEPPRRVFVSWGPPLAVFVLISLIAAPLMRTLTASYSGDTIYALATAAGAVNVLAFDYASLNRTLRQRDASELPSVRRGVAGGVLSLNAAAVACVLLASRLSRDLSVFVLMVVAVGVFAFCPSLTLVLANPVPGQGTPLLRRSLLPVFLVACIAGAAVALHLSLDPTQAALALALHAAIVTSVGVLGPFYFWSLHTAKHHMPGPWDIAHVREKGAS
mmetsp:Transcript_23627/g.69134  ORF Transcript_23627/g.69134 Transcript_23627/m.69134 type:complete len:244 (-) Transcript_23627:28-759(-)